MYILGQASDDTINDYFVIDIRVIHYQKKNRLHYKRVVVFRISHIDLNSVHERSSV